MNWTEEQTQWPSLFFPDVKIQKDIPRLPSFVGLTLALRWQNGWSNIEKCRWTNVILLIGSTYVHCWFNVLSPTSHVHVWIIQNTKKIFNAIQVSFRYEKHAKKLMFFFCLMLYFSAFRERVYLIQRNGFCVCRKCARCMYLRHNHRRQKQCLC